MLQKLITHMMKVTHTAVRIYSYDAYLTEYCGGHQNEDTLLDNKEMICKMIEKSSAEFPVLYSETTPLYYGLVVYSGNVLICGPVCFQKSALPDSAVGHAIYCDYNIFCEELLLLHNLLNNRNASIMDIQEQTPCSPDVPENVERELSRIYFRYQEKQSLHNPYDQEVRELNSIREGNVEKLMECMNERFDGQYGTLSRNPLRSFINLGIVTLALTARAAIDGGMLPEESFSLNDSYIMQLDSAASMGQVAEIIRQAKINYTDTVHQLQMNGGTHYLIEKTKNLIHKRMHEKIVIRELAEELNVTPEYLSTLFHREEGVTLNDYIMKNKIRLSENLLIYSNYTIEEISYYFGFCSQSHYGKIFKKWKQISPKQFRLRFGNRKFIEEFNKINP